jgi:hypothetical protein
LILFEQFCQQEVHSNGPYDKSCDFELHSNIKLEFVKEANEKLQQSKPKDPEQSNLNCGTELGDCVAHHSNFFGP